MLINEALTKIIDSVQLTIVSPYCPQYDLSNCEQEPPAVIKLSEAHQAMAALSYLISHDLRASLRTILWYSDLSIIDYVESLGEIGIRYFVTVKGSPAKRHLLILNSVSWKEVARHGSSLLMEESSLPKFSAQLRINDNSPTVLADIPALNVSLKNLLSNAFKYSTNSDAAIIKIGGDLPHGSANFMSRTTATCNLLEENLGVPIGRAMSVSWREKGGISWENSPKLGTTFFVGIPDKKDESASCKYICE